MIKHRVIKDFQIVSNDKKIFVLKSGSMIEDYKYQTKTESIQIDRTLIDNNPDFFQIIDWKHEIVAYLRTNKVPQPAQIGKKIIPFIEELVLSNTTSTSPIDDEELNHRMLDIEIRERRVKSKEEEVSIHEERVEKRERSFKEDMSLLQSKEANLNDLARSLRERETTILQKSREISEKERSIDMALMEGSKNNDERYKEIQDRISVGLRELSEKEKEIGMVESSLSERESDLSSKEEDLNRREREIRVRVEEITQSLEDLNRLDSEIKEWESRHWKMRRNRTPPSAIVD